MKKKFLKVTWMGFPFIENQTSKTKHSGTEQYQGVFIKFKNVQLGFAKTLQKATDHEVFL